MACKQAWIFVRGHYLFRNCDLWRTDTVQEQISEPIFAPMEAIVFIILQIFFAMIMRAVLKVGEYKNKSRHLAQKYARIFVHGHYLFREANSFPRAKLGRNCELRGTDNVQGQISEHIFASNGGYCVYCPSNLFRNPPGFSWGIFGHVTRLDQSRASEKIWWIISTDISKLQITAVTIDHKISNVLPSVKAVILWCESVSN